MAEHIPAIGPDEFDEGWLEAIRQTPFATLMVGLAGLTRLGERLLVPLAQLRASISGTFAEVNAGACTHQPFFASADAAEPALAARPGARVVAVDEMFDRPFVAYCRDQLAPLLRATPSGG